jgi:menaquinol-cytochrome c reductase iron-sulfur subunit
LPSPENSKGTNFSERRSFLRNAIAGLASLMGFAFAGPAGSYLFAKKGGPEAKVWADAGEVAEFSQFAPQEITFESRQTDGWNIEEAKASAWVVRQGDGSIVAFSPWCTHLGCAYHWESKRNEAAGGCFICPCHGSRFDANGAVLAGPASRPLDRYPTKTQGSRLWILPSADSEPS